MTKHEPRYTFASVGFAALMMLGFLPLGCGGGLGQVTARQEASNNRPVLPDKTVERLQACVAEYGTQFGPGHYRFNPHVRVDQEGYTQWISTEDMPPIAHDFAACTRLVLDDMALPNAVLNTPPSEDSVVTTNRSYMGSPVVVVIVVVELTEIVFEAAAYTFLFAVTVEVARVAEKDIADAARRRRATKDECAERYADCMDTRVSGEGGNTWKQTRCGICAASCDTYKAWPAQVGNGSCEYWKQGWGAP